MYGFCLLKIWRFQPSMTLKTPHEHGSWGIGLPSGVGIITSGYKDPYASISIRNVSQGFWTWWCRPEAPKAEEAKGRDRLLQNREATEGSLPFCWIYSRSYDFGVRPIHANYVIQIRFVIQVMWSLMIGLSVWIGAFVPSSAEESSGNAVDMLNLLVLLIFLSWFHDMKNQLWYWTSVLILFPTQLWMIPSSIPSVSLQSTCR